MSTLWTPSGEYAPKPEPEPVPASAPGPEGAPGPPGSEGAPSPADIEAMRQEVLAVLDSPVLDHVASHVSGLMELAALHLQGATSFGGSAPPDLAEASLAIDTVAAIAEGLGARLGPYEVEIGRALSQLRLAYVDAAGP